MPDKYPSPNKNGYSVAYYKKRVDYFEHTTKFYSHRLSLLNKLCGFHGKELVLNVGCGVGTTEVEFIDEYGKMVGIDHNIIPLEMAKDVLEQKGIDGKGAFFVKAKAEILPFKKNTFDMVICADFVEHISKDLYCSLLKEIHAILKKDAFLIIYTPSANHIFEFIKRISRKFTNNELTKTGVNFPDFLVESLRDHGFNIVDCFLQPTHIFLLQYIERSLMRVPFFRPLVGRRICIRATALKT